MNLVAFVVCINAMAPPEPITVRAEAVPARITLSEKLRLTITVQGPAPLRVEMPMLPLTKESREVWRVLRAEPARLESQMNGGECWSQTFVLDWWGRGENAAIHFDPITVIAGNEVRARQVPCADLNIAIDLGLWKNISPVEREAARNEALITPIEEVPPPAVHRASGLRGLMIICLVMILLVVLAAVLVWRVRAKPAPLSPLEWVRAELAKTHEGQIAARVPAVLREYLARAYASNAPMQTSAELCVEAQRLGWPHGLAAILMQCDHAHFSGEVLSVDQERALLADTLTWIEATQTASHAT